MLLLAGTEALDSSRSGQRLVVAAAEFAVLETNPVHHPRPVPQNLHSAQWDQVKKLSQLEMMQPL